MIENFNIVPCPMVQYILQTMAKFLERRKARKLRKQGQSIKVIAKKLSVSPSSVSSWCRDVVLTPKQIAELERRHKDPHYGDRLAYIQMRKRETDAKIKRLAKEGIAEIDTLNNKELFLVGIALYWAEGFKKDSQAGLASSDPDMIKVFIKWLQKCCGYSINDLIFRVTANASHRHRIDQIQQFWSNVTKTPTLQFQKPFYQKVKWKKTYENPNQYYGVLRIKVRKSTDFLRKIHGWIEGLKIQA